MKNIFAISVIDFLEKHYFTQYFCNMKKKRFLNSLLLILEYPFLMFYCLSIAKAINQFITYRYSANYKMEKPKNHCYFIAKPLLMSLLNTLNYAIKTGEAIAVISRYFCNGFPTYANAFLPCACAITASEMFFGVSA